MPQEWHHRHIIYGSLKHVFDSFKCKTTTAILFYERGINGKEQGLDGRNHRKPASSVKAFSELIVQQVTGAVAMVKCSLT